MSEKRTKNTKIVLGLFLAVIIISLMASAVITGETLYARNLIVDGVVVSIDWKSSNHQLPRIVLHSEFRSEIVISHHSVSLSKVDIKVGDKLVKSTIGNYCLVNDYEIQFSKYLGSDSYSDIFAYIFNRMKQE